MTIINLESDSVAPPADIYDPFANPFGHGYYQEAQVGGYTFYDCIDFFDATPEGDFLSNFYPSPFTVPADAILACLYPDMLVTNEQWIKLSAHTWETGEHFFQAFKADDIGDVFAIAMAKGPGTAKSLGRRCSMRPDWTEARVEVMRVVLANKFAYGTELGNRLLATDTKVLIEGTNWHDRIWGVYEGEGLNLLGVLLMEQRGYLKAVRRDERGW